jgi:hypothetical protein
VAEVFILRDKKTNNIFRIKASSLSDAKDKLRKLDQVNTAQVAVTPDGIPIKIGKDAVLRSPSGNLTLVGEGYSTSDPEKIRIFTEKLGEVTAGDISRSSINQSLIEQNPIMSRVAATLPAMGFGTGSFADEVIGLFNNDAKLATRALQKAMASERPLETFALQAGVGVAEVYGLVKRFPKLAELFAGKAGDSMISRTIMSAGGKDEGSIKDRLINPETAMDTAIGTGTGAAIGAPLPLIGAGIRRSVDSLRSADIPLISQALGVSRSAAMVIKNAFASGGDIDDAINAVNRAGKSGMLVDAEEAAMSLADAAGNAGARPASIISKSMSDRASALNTQLENTLAKNLGTETSPKKVIAELRGRNQADRTKAYNKAYNTPIDYSSAAGRNIEDVLDTIDGKIVKSAIDTANNRMRRDGFKNQQIKATILDNGDVEYETLPNVMQLDYLKRAVQRLAEKSKGEFGQATDDSRFYSSIARDLKNAIDDAAIDPQTGERVYSQAVRMGGDVIGEENAFKLGRDVLKPNVKIDDIEEVLGDSPSDIQLQAMRMGMGQYIKELLGDVKAVPSDPDIAARQLDAFVRATSSDNAKRKIMQVMGADANILLRQIDEVAQSATVRAKMRDNSRTNIRQNIQDTVEAQIQPGPIGTLARGEGLSSARKIIQEVTGMTDEAVDERKVQIYTEIAQALTNKNTAQAKKALQILKDAADGNIKSVEDNILLANEITTLIGSGVQKETERRAGLLVQ